MMIRRTKMKRPKVRFPFRFFCFLYPNA
jgi:hypothetical protein